MVPEILVDTKKIGVEYLDGSICMYVAIWYKTGVSVRETLGHCRESLYTLDHEQAAEVISRTQLSPECYGQWWDVLCGDRCVRAAPLRFHGYK